MAPRSLIARLTAAIVLLLGLGLGHAARADQGDSGRDGLRLAPAQQAWLAAHDRIRLGDDFAWPPFVFMDGKGVFSGISAGYVAWIGERLDVAITPVTGLTWAEVQDRIKRGEIDMLPAVTHSKEREAYLHFTKPYISFPIVIATRDDTRPVRTLGELTGKTVGVVKGYITHEILERDFPALGLVTFDSLAGGLAALEAGTLDAVVDNLGAITYEIRHGRLAHVKIAAATSYTFQLSMGVRKDWPELAAALDAALDAMSSRDKAAIENTWLAIDVHFGVDPVTVLWWGIPVSLSVAVMVAVIMTWNRRLAREVETRKAAEAKLSLETQHLARILDTASDGIHILDDQGRIIEFSPSFARMLGYSPEEVKTLCVADWDAGFPREQLIPPLQPIAEIPARFETRHRRKDGTVFDVEVSARGITMGGHTYLHASARDISERKRSQAKLQASEAQLRAIIDSEPECIKMVDAGGALLQMNPAGLAMIEADSLEQVAGQPVLDVIAPEHRDAFLAMHRKIIAGETGELQFEVLGLKGTRRWLETRAVPMDLDGARVHLAVTRDISQRKALELDLMRSNAELERFAYVASHDLRQPLRMVSSYIALLERRLAGRLNDDEKEFIAFAVDGANRMDRMIIDLLDYSRIGRNAAEKQPVDLARALDSATTNLKAAMAEIGAAITVLTPLPVVLGYDSELERLFQNLIGNAIKFVAAGRPPAITVRCEDKAAEWVVAIADNGIGIAPHDHDRLFQIFQRLVRQDQYQGTGIGLAACRKIVEHHGGRIWVESELGVGSTFRFSLPKSPEAGS